MGILCANFISVLSKKLFQGARLNEIFLREKRASLKIM
jgi:hypothetical protein